MLARRRRQRRVRRSRQTTRLGKNLLDQSAFLLPRRLQQLVLELVDEILEARRLILVSERWRVDSEVSKVGDVLGFVSLKGCNDVSE